ncbi:13187_t:CDS:2 [Cetraspora pellucida]|uniref:13187_t:CDS:1 n=1 Tax=Cetraspora pellucida TaxID=1433469 RepID=A0A9N9DUT7_9GLOM|nr:13187_t:CDS:2 [Cetraspora pellucida]
MCDAIYLSLDKLWDIPYKIGLKASLLNLCRLKLLLFVTPIALGPNNNENDIERTQTTTIKKNCNSLSAEL